MRYRLISLFILVLFGVQGCGNSDSSEVLSKQDGVTLFSDPIRLEPFEFKNKRAQSVDNQVFLGRWNLLYFGYTYCPDVCPMALSDMRKTLKLIEPSLRDRYKVWFVSVDPNRDTPEVLNSFLNYFNPEFDALTDNPASLRTLAGQMHAFYAKVKTTGEAPYLMDHTANIALVDPNGKYRGFIEPPHNPESLKRILTMLLSL